MSISKSALKTHLKNAQTALKMFRSGEISKDLCCTNLLTLRHFCHAYLNPYSYRFVIYKVENHFDKIKLSDQLIIGLTFMVTGNWQFSWFSGHFISIVSNKIPVELTLKKIVNYAYNYINLVINY